MKNAKTIRRYEITDAKWEKIKDMLPAERTGKAGRPSSDNRTALNGMLWIDRTGAPWEDLPNRYGAKSTVFDRFKKWTEMGIFDKIFEILSCDADMQDLSIDSSSTKVHQHAAGAKKGRKTQTKIHALVDGLGNPVKFLFTGGNVSDCTVAVKLLNEIDISNSIIMGDRAYGTVDIRNHIESQGSTYCIPPKSNAIDPWECDWWQYKERHLVECFFNKLKQFRRVATRYDKLINHFKSFVFLASIMILLK